MQRRNPGSRLSEPRGHAYERLYQRLFEAAWNWLLVLDPGTRLAVLPVINHKWRG